VTPTRSRVLDAAIELVGTEGLRALTHVRVDARAGVPRGTTSNYFRTRRALVTGVMDRFLEFEFDEARPALQPASAEELAAAIHLVIGRLTTGAERARTAARLALFIEGGHDDDVRDAVLRGRELAEAPVIVALAKLGASDPRAAAVILITCMQGVLLRRIARLDESDPRPVIEAAVRAALA
jgi:AcrR family transcriptional regulator